MIGTIQRRRGELDFPVRRILLTFDDGPVPHGQTAQLLDILEAHTIRAAFCLVGRRIAGNEDLVRRIDRQGHTIVNHGFAHRVTSSMTSPQILEDLAAFDRAIAATLDRPQWASRYFRPPGGHWTPGLDRLVSGAGKTLMPLTFFAWDIFPFPRRESLILEGMLANLRRQAGGIFMLHEAVVPLAGEQIPAPPRSDRPWVPALAERFIDQALLERFEFVDPEIITGIPPGR